MSVKTTLTLKAVRSRMVGGYSGVVGVGEAIGLVDGVFADPAVGM